MPSEELLQQIRSLNPEELRMFKERLSSGTYGSEVSTYLSGIPELQDITGNQRIPTSQLGEPKQNPILGAVEKATAPLRWIDQNVTQPLSAMAMSPFTPSVPGTENLPWLQRERAEYAQWEEPTLLTTPWGYKVRPTKGIVEMLPWLAVPSAGGIAGRLGTLAAKGGKLAGAAAIGQKILKPAVMAENLTNPFAWKGGVGKLVGKEGVTKELSKPTTLYSSIIGVTPETFQKIVQGIKTKFPRMSDKKVTQLAYEEAAKIPGVKVVGAGKQVLPLATEVMPEGFNDVQKSALLKLYDVIAAFKPATQTTKILASHAKGAKMSTAEALRVKGIAQGESNEAIIRKYMAAQKGELPEAPISERAQQLRAGMLEEEEEALRDVLVKGSYKTDWQRLSTIHAYETMMQGLRLQENQLVFLEKAFGSELVSQLLKKRSWGEKAWEQIIDIANVPRVFLSSFDISGLLRQGGVLFTANPIEGLKSVRPMIRAMWSEKNEIAMDHLIRSRAHFASAEAHGLYVAPRTGLVSPLLSQREEAFMSKWASKVIGIKASNRAYVTGLNDIRTQVWEKTIGKWESQGKALTELDYDEMAKFINWATGRGTLFKSWERQGSAINAFLFAPKLLFSRVELPTMLFSKSQLVRAEARRTLMTDVAVGASVMTLAKMTGAADWELDPRSSDFGKLIIGNQRIDIWTGYAQYVRLAGQLVTEKHKSGSGMVTYMPRKESFDRFVSSKLSPALGLLKDLLEGETYLGEAIPPRSMKGLGGQIWARMGPIAVQEMIQGVQEAGLDGAAVAGLGFLGVGVATYTDFLGRTRDSVAQQEHGMSWDEVGKTFGISEQLRLEQTSPEIIAAEKDQETRFATGDPSVTKKYHTEGRQIEEHYRKIVGEATARLQQTNNYVEFKTGIEKASDFRRKSYDMQKSKPEFRDIVEFYNRPMTPEQKAQMNPGDVARREYYQTMFSPDMTVNGVYDFDRAEQKEREFTAQWGQEALDYIEAYKGSRWLDKPIELKAFEQSKEMLKPYFEIEDQVWSLYPEGLKEISKQIDIANREEKGRGDLILRRYPQILRARELIALYKQQYKLRNPQVAQILRVYYGR